MLIINLARPDRIIFLCGEGFHVVAASLEGLPEVGSCPNVVAKGARLPILVILQHNHLLNFFGDRKVFFLKGDFYFLYFYVRYSTLLHLPPLRFHCVGGCWERAQDSCDFGIDSQTL